MRLILPCGCLQKDEDDEDQAHLHKPRGKFSPYFLSLISFLKVIQCRSSADKSTEHNFTQNRFLGDVKFCILLFLTIFYYLFRLKISQTMLFQITSYTNKN